SLIFLNIIQIPAFSNASTIGKDPVARADNSGCQTLQTGRARTGLEEHEMDKSIMIIEAARAS
ncbi:MAG: hypothetical protein ACFFCW_49380, partial [Candidatus Hodarchaeota archaeon]